MAPIPVLPAAPAAPRALKPTTSLEIALSTVLSSAQPLTIRTALAAYIHAADFGVPESAFVHARGDEPFSAEDAILAFEHALDKHPLPVPASAVPASRLPKRKRTASKARTRARRRVHGLRSPGGPSSSPSASSYSFVPKMSQSAPAPAPQPVAYRRPFVDEVDRLRREYYAEKARVIPPPCCACTCGRCGEPVLDDDVGGFICDDDEGGVPYNSTEPCGHGFGGEHACWGAAEPCARDVSDWEAQLGERAGRGTGGAVEDGFYVACGARDLRCECLMPCMYDAPWLTGVLGIPDEHVKGAIQRRAARDDAGGGTI
jgi:hypothetical protein